MYKLVLRFLIMCLVAFATDSLASTTTLNNQYIVNSAVIARINKPLSTVDLTKGKSINDWPDHIKNIVVFGDSLSDDGNDFYLTRQINLFTEGSIFPVHDPLIKSFGKAVLPSPVDVPYVDGRFSNGKNWAEDLANDFSIQDTGRSRSGSFIDYAYGGAWAEGINHKSSLSLELATEISIGDFSAAAKTLTATGSDLKNDISISHMVPPDLSMQILSYQLKLAKQKMDPTVHNPDTSNTLYVIWAGANDYLSERKLHPMQAPTWLSNGDKYPVAVNGVVEAIRQAVAKLIDDGAKNILLMGVPDLSTTPYADTNSIAYQKNVLKLSEDNNLELKSFVENIPNDLPLVAREKFKYGDNKAVIYADDSLWQNELVTNPTRYGYSKKNANKLCHDTDFTEQNLNGALIDPELNLLATSHKNSSPNECDNQTKTSTHIYFDNVHPTKMTHCILANTLYHYLKNMYSGSNDEVAASGNQTMLTVMDEAHTYCQTLQGQGSLQP